MAHNNSSQLTALRAALPALIADCDAPGLLADLTYADFRESFDSGLEELVAAIRDKRE
jgi:hypothetical protein